MDSVTANVPVPITNVPGMPVGMAPTPNMISASLYVGSIFDASEAVLYEAFSKVGPVASIRVCRDTVTRRSLGYGYVNFYTMEDAERALDTLNYSLVKGHQIRIMWSQRDPALRKSGVGNIFIKNLDKNVDNRSLHDTFSAFGNILSCKVVTDENGQTRGYGYVHFETADAAEKAIANVNGKLLAGKKVFVAHHVSRKERDSKWEELRKNFTNVYVKNLDESVSDQELLDLFSKFGEITSCVLSKDDQGKSRGFGFINFREHEAASKACETLNDSDIKSKKIYVARAQKKSERLQELQRRWEAMKQERSNKYQGVNLYVKNLDDNVDGDRLRQEFAAIGTITSHKIVTDDKGNSRGFGFVCFSSSDEALKAVQLMHNRMIGSKPIYVALAQRKEERRSILAMQHQQRMMQQQTGMGYMYPPNQQIYYTQNPGMNMPMRGQQPYYPTAMPPRPRWQGQGQQMHQPGRPFVNMGPPMYNNGPMGGQMRPNRQGGGGGGGNRRIPGGPMGGMPGGPNSGMMPNGMPMGMRGPMPPQSNPGMMQPVMMGGQPPRGGSGGRSNYGGKPFGNNSGNNVRVMGPPINVAPNMNGVEPLTSERLANMSAEDQKRALGDRIFMQLNPLYPDLAGKITGMLLDLDNSELLLLLENQQQMEHQVQEAIKELEKHNLDGQQVEGAAIQAN